MRNDSSQKDVLCYEVFDFDVTIGKQRTSVLMTKIQRLRSWMHHRRSLLWNALRQSGRWYESQFRFILLSDNDGDLSIRNNELQVTQTYVGVHMSRIFSVFSVGRSMKIYLKACEHIFVNPNSYFRIFARLLRLHESTSCEPRAMDFALTSMSNSRGTLLRVRSNTRVYIGCEKGYECAARTFKNESTFIEDVLNIWKWERIPSWIANAPMRWEEWRQVSSSLFMEQSYYMYKQYQIVQEGTNPEAASLIKS